MNRDKSRNGNFQIDDIKHSLESFANQNFVTNEQIINQKAHTKKIKRLKKQIQVSKNDNMVNIKIMPT